jgi:hypothetical protein
LRPSVNTLRQLTDDARARTTKQLALQIRALGAGMNKLIPASSLASLSTEGDFGHETLQEVAKTLAESLKQHPLADQRGKPAAPCVELAQLVHPSPRRPHSWSRRTSGFRTWIFLCRICVGKRGN